jgi:hypothetical protein
LSGTFLLGSDRGPHGYDFSAAAIVWNCSSAVWRSSAISCASTSGSGRPSESSRLLSLCQKMSRLCDSSALLANGRLAVWRPGQLVGHREEQEQGDLLGVGHVGQAVVAQDVGEVPCLGDDLLGVGTH